MKFGTSTHRSRWLFTADRLKEMRTQLNRATAEQLQAQSSAASTSTSGPQPLTLEQERKLLKYYESSIQRLCRDDLLKRRSSRVQGTAVTYLKRFYLKESVLEHDPAEIFAACVYVACKTEEHYVSATNLVKLKLAKDEKKILRLELAVLKALAFDLVVHLPYKAINGNILRLKELAEKDPEFREAINWKSVEPKLASIEAKAYSATDALMLSDAPLLFPPGQLALAALRSAFTNTKESLRPYIRMCVQAAMQDEKKLGELMENLVSLDTYGVAGSAKVNQQEVRDIDKQLKVWLKAMKPKDVKTKSKKRQAVDDAGGQQKEAKREKKAEP